MQDPLPNLDPAAATEASPSPVQRRGMLAAILTQSCGVIAQLAFKYGIILLYLRSLGIPATRILVYVALPFLGYLLTVPVAYYADRWGKKRLATFGLAVSTAGMALLALSGSLPQASREATAVLGILVFSVAQVPFSA
ncbi:MAG: hypothetical protein HN849_18335, partial [Victivallales bacterium]|nr:hypothetical protein [Victivallales bacterium]